MAENSNEIALRLKGFFDAVESRVLAGDGFPRLVRTQPRAHVTRRSTTEIFEGCVSALTESERDDLEHLLGKMSATIATA